MFEDFINAMQNFTRNRMRTFLSLLGVIIGVASVIVITSMGASSTKQIESTFGSSGLDIVNVSAGFMSKRAASASAIQFDETFRQTLFDNIKNVKKIWYKNTLSTTITYGDTSVSASASAIESGYLEMYGLKLDYGEYFSVVDDVEGMHKIILGSEIASGLFPEGNAVGKQILLVASKITFPFTVIGVLKEQSSGFESSTQGVYIPRGFYSKKVSPNPLANNIMIQATKPEHTTQMVTDVNDYCTQLNNGTTGTVNVMSMQTMINQMSEITQTLSLMLSAIAAISLLVGGIGIMNIMIVTVTERRQEIGIRKALGASPRAIRQQFLVESASISLFGGIMGIVLGIAISLAVEYVQSQSYIINWSACVIAFVFSVFVGIFFGLNPASRAAKLDPVEALSGE